MIKRIFVDMDDVIFDFEKGIELLTGKPIHEHEEFPKVWRETDLFFANLPPMEDAHVLMDYLSKTGIPLYVLSSVSAEEGTHLHSQRSLEKHWALNKHFGDYTFHDRIFVPKSGEDKAEYAAKGNLLIDDWDINTKPFVRDGGEAILHTSAESTINKLEERLNGSA